MIWGRGAIATASLSPSLESIDRMLPSIPWNEALLCSGLLDLLAAFDPRVAGTLPLGIGVPGSDIDILCHAPDPSGFSMLLWRHLKAEEGFRMHQWTGSPRPIIASFIREGWPFEIFGATEPVERQAGWRHFAVEQRLLSLGGASLRAAVLAKRGRGMKTEPAFALALGLSGDPYEAILALYGRTDEELGHMLRTAGH